MKLYRCNETMITHSPTMKAVFDQLNGFGALIPVEIDVKKYLSMLPLPDAEALKWLGWRLDGWKEAHVRALYAALGIGEEE